MIAFSYEYYLLGSNITNLKSNKTDFDVSRHSYKKAIL